MLEVTNATIGYGRHTIVQSVSLQLRKGEIGSLLGPSGCGKTTLLRAIAGFEPLRDGHIRLFGQYVSVPGECLAPQRRDIGMVFQDHALFPHLNVAQNVAFGLHRQPEAKRKARVQEMLALVGLQTMADRWPHQLSGGQQQRVALARALAPEPSLLLMDEPFSSLDTSMREGIAREVRTILKQAQATALMVTHDQNEAFAMADVVGVMACGQLMQWATATQVYCQPATQEVARIVGEGALLPAQLTSDGRWSTPLGVVHAHHPHYAEAVSPLVLLRPEHVGIAPISPTEAASGTVLGGYTATVHECLFRGSHFVYRLTVPDGHEVMARADIRGHVPHEAGQQVRLYLTV